MPRYLLIVARDQRELFDYLSRDFAPDHDVQVLFDRRFDERRHASDDDGHAAERRQADRRQGDIEMKLATVGFAVVKGGS
jgi:hypothetical protein